MMDEDVVEGSAGANIRYTPGPYLREPSFRMPDYTARIGEAAYPVGADALARLDIVTAGPQAFHVVHEGRAYACELVDLDLPAKRLTVRVNGRRFALALEDDTDALVRQLGLGVAEAAAGKDVYAPMPGLVLEVLAEPGQAVAAGDRLLVLEAMKMENSLTAEADGTISAVHVATGDAVEKRQLLIELA